MCRQLLVYKAKYEAYRQVRDEPAGPPHHHHSGPGAGRASPWEAA